VKLRHQLFIVSLLLLGLPWAGCQYLQAVEGVMREMQGNVLTNISQSVADQLSSQTELWREPFINSDEHSLTLYATMANTAMIVDGYEDDWRFSEINPLILNQQNEKPVIDLKAQSKNQQFYFFIKIEDKDIQYFNPASNDLFSADHISLSFFDEQNQKKTYHLYAGAPGNVVARFRDQAGRLREQNFIKGVWRETNNGYRLEVEIDQSLVAHGFTMDVIHADENKLSVTTVGEQYKNQRFNRIQLVTQSSNMREVLKRIQLKSFSARILNKDRWVVAHFQDQTQESNQSDTPWILEWLYRLLLSSQELEVRNYFSVINQWPEPEIKGKNQSDNQLQWYRSSNIGLQTIASVTMPIGKNKRVGYLVIEKTNDQMVTLTNSAFNQLLIYSLGLFFIVGLGLLAYAGWLSWRVRRLNRITDLTINQQGVIDIENIAWPDLNSSDELGDLARSYHGLLLRLKENQDYLRTLSNKLSHELRTPIAIVRSSLDNLSQTQNAEEQKQYRHRAQMGIERLSNILNAMSAANRIEQSLEETEFETIDLQSLLSSLIQSYEDAYEDQQFQFISNGDVFHAQIVEDLFLQMIDKIVDNARDFSEKDQPVIVSLEQSNQAIKITISNTGPLLPDTMTDRIFESMISFRETQADTNIHLGMGLYIVRIIVELHRGTLKAENREDGTGVVFTLIIPSH
jgi:dedicated sortase system histidine kinase